MKNCSFPSSFPLIWFQAKSMYINIFFFHFASFSLHICIRIRNSLIKSNFLIYPVNSSLWLERCPDWSPYILLQCAKLVSFNIVICSLFAYILNYITSINIFVFIFLSWQRIKQLHWEYAWVNELCELINQSL